jgi:hypothetical protein
MQAGTQVTNTVVIQSDDRELGIDDGSPIIPIGTQGVVLGMSEDFLEDNHLKDGCKDCVVVAFDLPGGKHNFDVSPSELMVQTPA